MYNAVNYKIKIYRIENREDKSQGMNPWLSELFPMIQATILNSNHSKLLFDLVPRQMTPRSTLDAVKRYLDLPGSDFNNLLKLFKTGYSLERCKVDWSQRCKEMKGWVAVPRRSWGQICGVDLRN